MKGWNDKMSEPYVLYEVKDRVAYITLNRPEQKNLIDTQFCLELDSIWKRFNADDEAWVAIIHGKGEMYSIGADVNPGALKPNSILKAWPWNGIKTFKPIISAVHGMANGAGYGLAVLHSDVTVAAEGTLFVEPESAYSIPGRIFEYIPVMPFKISLEFYLTSQPIEARRAYEIGMIQSVVPKARLMDEARHFANILKKNAPLTMKAIKFAHYKATDNVANFSRREIEEYLVPQVKSEDWQAGRKAYVEGREPPEYKGR
jgi:enoyl-CoA hydratase